MSFFNSKPTFLIPDYPKRMPYKNKKILQTNEEAPMRRKKRKNKQPKRVVQPSDNWDSLATQLELSCAISTSKTQKIKNTTASIARYCPCLPRRAIKAKTVNAVARKRYNKVKRLEQELLKQARCMGLDPNLRPQGLTVDLACKIGSYFFDHKAYITKLLEDVFVLVYWVVRSRSVADYGTAIMTFIKLRHVGPIFCKDNAKKLVKAAQRMSDALGTKLSELFVPQAESFESLEFLRKGLDRYDIIKNCDAFKKLYKFILYALSNSLFECLGLSFDKFGYTKMEAEAVRLQHKMGPDFFHCMLDTVVFLCERGAQCVKTGNLDPIFHSGSSYVKWFDISQRLIRESKLMSDCTTHGIVPEVFYEELLDALDKGKAITKYARSFSDIQKATIQRTLAELEMVRATELSRRAAQQQRMAPSAWLIHGGSKVGKTQFQDVLFYFFTHVFEDYKLPADLKYAYTRNSLEEFWSNFESHMWCIRFDDIAFKHPNKCPDMDDSLGELIMTINNMTFVPPQADLEKKGKTPVRPLLVTATTNTAHLNATFYFSCPLAVRRRLPYTVSIKPKQKYTHDGVTLETSLLPEVATGELPDFWHITVYETKAIVTEESQGANINQCVRQEATLSKCGEYDSIHDFLAFYGKTVRQHFRVQKQAMACGAAVSQIHVCKEHMKLKKLCGCLEPQSLDLTPQVMHSVCMALRSTHDSLSDLTTEGMSFIQHSAYSLDMNIDVYWSVLYQHLSVASPFAIRVHQKLAARYILARRRGDLSRFLWFARVESIEQYWRVTLMNITGLWIFNWLALKIFVFGAVMFDALLTFDLAYIWNSFWSYLFAPWRNTAYCAEYARCVVLEAGEVVSRTIGIGQRACQIAIAVGAIAVAYKVGKYFMGDWGEAVVQSEEKAPTVPKPEKESVWKKDDFQLSTFNVSERCASWKTMPRQQVHEKLSRHCLAMTVYHKDGIKLGKAIAIGGHYFLVNNHMLPKGQDLRIGMTISHDSTGVNPNLPPALVVQSQITRCPDQDVALLKLPNLPPFKDIQQLFATDAMLDNAVCFEGSYLHRSEGGVMRIWETRNIKYEGIYRNRQLDAEMRHWKFHSMRRTEEGDCGSMLLAYTPRGPVIAGIHVVGAPSGLSGAVAVTQELLSKLHADDQFIVQSGEPVLSSSDCERTVGTLSPWSSVRFAHGCANVYGTFQGWRPAHTSSVGPTYIAEQVLAQGYELKFGAPVMSGWRPWYNGLCDVIEHPTIVNQRMLDLAAEGYLADVMAGLTDADLAEVHVYDTFTAVNGAAGVRFVDKMNRSSSMGAPWRKQKKFYMHATDSVGENLDPVEFTQEVLDRADEIIKKYHKNERAMPVFTSALKDEPQKFKKIKAALTRVFCCAPADFTIVMRKYLLALARLMQKNGKLFECAVGTVCQSTEWQNMREYIVHFGLDFIVAGDYAKYDKSMSAQHILKAFWIYRKICERAGYAPPQLRVVNGLGEDVAFPLVDYNGDLIELFGSNPSGHSFTVLVNGTVGSLLLREAYLALNPKHECHSFKQHVHLYTYGDDNIMGVDPSIADWFNHTSIQAYFASVNITYTMADKDRASVPFIHIDEATFLKRSWRFDEDVGAYLCPLEHDSIEKMLTVCTASKAVSPQAQAVDIIHTATREYFYYGKEIFHKRVRTLEDIAIAADLGVYFEDRPLPTWEQLTTQFWENSQDGQGSLVGIEAKKDLMCDRSHDVVGLRDQPPEVDSDTHQISAVLPSDTVPVFTGGAEETPTTSLNFSRPGWGVDRNIESPAQTLNPNLQPQTLDTEDPYASLLLLSDAELGALMRSTWRPQQHLRYKKTIMVRWGANTLRAQSPSLDDAQALIAADIIQRNRLRLAPQGLIPLTIPEPTPIAEVFSGDLLKPSIDSQIAEAFLYPILEENLKPQSEDISSDVPNTESSLELEQQETVEFADTASGPMRGLSSSNRPIIYSDGGDDDASLGSFLQRPVRIANFTWNESDAVNTSHTYQPWYLFFNDTRIKNKLANYAFIQCDLVVKVLINASPFYYGAMLMSYQPLTALTASTITADTVGTRHFIPYSQRPHLWILPQCNQGGSMRLPFFQNQTWLNVWQYSQFQNMGTLTFLNFTQLQSANGATGAGVTIQIYAWAENVRLSGPTLGGALAVQAKDEYETGFKGPISGPASAVSNFAKFFTGIPFIGELATATQMGAKAVAIGARALGYSNPPVIANAMPFRSVPFPQLASTEISYPVEKLTIDPKNELTIDPAIVGMGPEDELSIRYLSQRESYLCTSTWTNSNAVDTILFTSAVTPNMFDNDNGANKASNPYIYMTPSCWVSQLFADWRGDVIFRFRFIVSPYHKGRVRISYDPAGYTGENVTTDAVSSTVCHTKVIDLANETDVELRVPYTQSLPWLQNETPIYANLPWSTSASPTFTHSFGFTNGSIIMRVLNAITGPTASVSINILVSVRMADNFELANPRNVNADQNLWSWFPPQSKDLVHQEEEVIPTRSDMGPIGSPSADRYLMNFGEHILSLRQLLRRHSLTRVAVIAVPANDVALWKQNMTRFALSPGFDPFGYDSAKGVITTGSNFPYNFVFMTPLAWVMPAFVGVRGSTSWAFNVDNVGAIGQFRIMRLAGQGATSFGVSTYSAAYSDSSTFSSGLINNSYSGAAGTTITNQNTQSGIAVELPMYNNYRFQSTSPGAMSDPYDYSSGTVLDGANYDCHRLEVSINTHNVANNGVARMWQYVGIGTDFNLHMFLNVPTMFAYSTTPTPN